MRCRWIRAAGLGTALLTATVLAVLPGPAAAAQREDQLTSRRAFWDQQERWSDLGARKALRATRQAERWEVLVDLEKNGEWASQGFLEEVYRRRPEPSLALDKALRDTLDSIGTVLLIGEVRSAKGGRLYVVAAVLDQDSSFQDSEGRPLKIFVPLHVNGSYQDAQQFAQLHEKIYDGTLGNGESPDFPVGDVEKAAPACEWMCGNQRNTRYSGCSFQASVCISSAMDARDSCIAGCNGASGCISNCNTQYNNNVAFCTANYNSCTGVADQLYNQCIDQCDGGGWGGCSVATNTVTSTLSLDGRATLHQKLAPSPIHFELARTENRGAENFVMDEWALVKKGQVRSSSNPAFARAVTGQRPVAAEGPFLMIQEAVHPMNSRHVPKPEVKISNTRLAPSERGAGQIVAARIELSPTRAVDRVEIVYTSVPMDESRLKELVSRRIGLVFATEKGHRTAVYLAFRLTDHLELLDTVTVFPKCCCGGVHCI